MKKKKTVFAETEFVWIVTCPDQLNEKHREYSIPTDIFNFHFLTFIECVKAFDTMSTPVTGLHLLPQSTYNGPSLICVCLRNVMDHSADEWNTRTFS